MTIFNTPQNQRLLGAVSQQYKLTPATLAYKLTKGSWIPAKHLMYISSRVAKGIARGNARIIISAPPRHGKSELTSIHVPVWTLENFAQKRIILAGYGADLTEGFGRRVRDQFLNSENHTLLSTRIRDDARAVGAFLTQQNGGMFSVGLGGALTGRGADVLLIDDYIKEIKEALSPAYRDYVWDWFVTTAYTRLEPGGSCIIIATRWHSDDLIGRILKNYPGEWEYIEIPAEAMPNDILGREVGEPLFPERYDLDSLHDRKRTLGSIYYQALYQQRPVDESKKISDATWLNRIDAIPYDEVPFLKWARIWDLAATEDGGDYTVGSLIAYSKRSHYTYIVDVKRDQKSPGQVEQWVKETAAEDGVDVEVGIEQEPGSAGKALVEHYNKTVLPDHTVTPLPTNKNKLVRAQPFLAAAEDGTVYIVKGAWNDAYTKEFDAFPGSANDDQIDTTAAGYTLLSGKKVFSASWGRSSSEPKRNNNENTKAINRAQFISSQRLQRSSFVRGATFGRTPT